MVAVAGALAAAGLPALQAAAADDAITITKTDFRLSIDDVMKSVERVESMAAAGTSSADYARAYSRLQNDLASAHPPVAEWDEDKRERLKALPEPTESAWQALDSENARTEERLRARTEEAQREHEQNLASRRDQQRSQAEQERLDREAELQEARIDELEARTDYYNDSSYYPGNWWWSRGSHWHPNLRISWRPDRSNSATNRPTISSPIIFDLKARDNPQTYRRTHR